MNGGILALVELDGREVGPADAAALGLAASGPRLPFRLGGEWQTDDSVLQDAKRCTILVGHIADPAGVARTLCVAENLRPVQIARAALDRWGGDAAARLPGEWLIFDWQIGTATIIQSAARWVRTFYARRGSCIAISPDLFSLARLSWIGRELDEEGMLYSLARGALRSQQTILTNVSELRAGECIRFTSAGTASTVSLPFIEVPRWQGSFAQATQEASRLLHQIVKERLVRHGNVACLLSGGLDSSLLAMTLADGLRDDQRAVCLTSVAPPGSGLADEFQQAQAVAECLGLDLEAVAPGPVPGIYAPDPAAFAEANGPSLSVRHYLYKALTDRAHALGVTGMFDGSFGEMTVTGLLPLHSWSWQLRQYAKRVLGRGEAWHATPFCVRLAPHRLHGLPTALDAAIATAPTGPRSRRQREAWGYFPGVEKIMRDPASAIDAAIIEYPFRDQRLLQLFAGFPAHFLEHGGLNRAPARAMMAGRIPDAIRLRRDTMPFSPDYMLRLRTDAPAARLRVPAFRKADIADWLDLDWLDASLARFSSQGPRGIADAFEVQLTAMTAEFLLWWRVDAN